MPRAAVPAAAKRIRHLLSERENGIVNIRFWIAAALLAGSWLLGLNYFYPINPWAWSAVVAAAVLLLGKTNGALGATAGLSSSAENTVGQANRGTRAAWPIEAFALVLLLPAAWFAPWPYRAAPLLIVLGLALRLLPTRRRWADWLAGGAIAAGVVMFVQALILEVYITHTARSHELPWPLPDALAGIATLLGIDAAADGSNIVMHSMRQTHRLAATWELLLDPATLLFFVGALAMLPMAKPKTTGAPSDATDGRGFMAEWRIWIGELRILTLVMLVWLPVRAGLLMALYLHRVLRSDMDRPLHAMNHFFSPWMLLLLLVVPVLLAWRFVRRPVSLEEPVSDHAGQARPLHEQPSHPSSLFHLFSSAGLIALAVAIFTAAIYWDPPGRRKDGRVIVVERHSQWEPTTKPYDTTWFVEPKLFDEGSGYNYARIYRHLEQFYDVSRLLETDKIDDETLAECDVLIIKTPTERYSPKEIEAVRRFVEQGGGLLLIGEHTNYERSATVINDIIRPMGFIFRDDLQFSFNQSPYEQSYLTPTVPHPVVQHVPPMDFAGACSIDPGNSRGRPVIVCTGLWSMGPEYHHSNFFPIPQHCPEMRYGAFVQAWATRYGHGRVLAFTDSTIFSNFCVGQPGKSELMLGMVEWLNHASPWADPRPWLILLGIPPLVIGLWMARGFGREWLALLAAGSCGWVVGSLAVIGTHSWAMPIPKRIHPECLVVVDRTTSNVPLAKGLYPQGDDEGYGMLEAWLSRLDCQSVRKEGPEAFSGDVLVAICPSRSVPEEFRQALEKYVADGGRLLVIDSPKNYGSTANSLLWPFGLTIHHDQEWMGKLSTVLPLPTVDIEQACEISGGQPLAKLDKLPVAALVRHGKGSVMAVGFGSLWNDTRMGETWMAEPDATVKARYDVLFGLLRPFFHGREFPPPKAEKNDDEKSSILKEFGPAEL